MDEKTLAEEENPSLEETPEEGKNLPATVEPLDPKAQKKEQTELARREIATQALRSLSLDETQDLAGLWRWAKVLAASGMFSDVRGPAQAVAKIMAGRELGFSAMASMTAFYFANGKMALTANAMAAIIKAAPSKDYRILELTATRCELEFFETRNAPGASEVQRESVGKSEFTIADAEKAGLTRGDNWRKYPRNMLFARALSNGAKWFCPDLFQGGAYVAGEVGGDDAPIDVDFSVDPS